MGSQPQDYVLPDASAAHLILTQPTEAEKNQTWTLNHEEWGGALSLSEYLEREPYIASIPLAADGGMTHWILTDPSVEAGSRPVLASGESTRKRVLYLPAAAAGSRGDAGEVKEGIAYGVGSIYTYPQFRGKRYASRLLRELSVALRTWPQRQGLAGKDGEGQQQQQQRHAVCSALWSDIGKDFYARKGWAAFPSLHVEFPVTVTTTTTATNGQAATNGTAGGGDEEEEEKEKEKGGLTLTPVTYANLASLCEEDERILRARLLPRAARATGKTCVAFAPDHDAMRWHLYRDDFIASLVFGGRAGASEVKGAVAAASTVGGRTTKRVWAVWSRSYHGKDPDPASEEGRKNTLYILRLVIDDDAEEEEGEEEKKKKKEEGDGDGDGGGEDEDLQRAFDAVLSAAVREARAWKLAKIDLWNPTPAARRLIDRCGREHRWVDREVDSIPSLMWYGDGDGKEKEKEKEEEIEWVANEKFCWC
ncbi:hypothetical protein F5X99DRAFT_427292 [Biscogniauxia marginata]|nr:hypothetical protein F5X99DRAFT_427292 [Biscogniauxia marginata]